MYILCICVVHVNQLFQNLIFSTKNYIKDWNRLLSCHTVEPTPEKLAKISKNKSLIRGILSRLSRGMIGASNCRREKAYFDTCVCVVQFKVSLRLESTQRAVKEVNLRFLRIRRIWNWSVIILRYLYISYRYVEHFLHWYNLNLILMLLK